MVFGIGKAIKKALGLTAPKSAPAAGPSTPTPTKATQSGQSAAELLFAGFADDLDQTFVRLGRGRDFRAGVTSKVKALGVSLGS